MLEGDPSWFAYSFRMWCHMTSQHITSPPPTRHGNTARYHQNTTTRRNGWRLRWLVALRTFYTQLLSLVCRFLFSWHFRHLPPPARPGITCRDEFRVALRMAWLASTFWQDPLHVIGCWPDWLAGSWWICKWVYATPRSSAEPAGLNVFKWYMFSNQLSTWICVSLHSMARRQCPSRLRRWAMRTSALTARLYKIAGLNLILSYLAIIAHLHDSCNKPGLK